jgi:hypothetical protein
MQGVVIAMDYREVNVLAAYPQLELLTASSVWSRPQAVILLCDLAFFDDPTHLLDYRLAHRHCGYC